MLKALTRAPLQLAAAALVAATLCGGVAQAQPRLDFDQADANHDGRVTFEEFAACATRRLMHAGGPMAVRFRQLSPEEQTARLRQRFEQLDKDHKGYLDRKDLDGA